MVQLLVFEIFLFAIFVYVLVQTSTWVFETALMPLTFSIGGCLLMLVILWRDLLFFLRSRKRLGVAGSGDDIGSRGGKDEEPFRISLKRASLVLGSMLLIYVSVKLVWFHVVVPASAILYIRVIGGPKTRWRDVAVIVIILEIMFFVVYDWLIRTVWPTPLLSQLLTRLFH